MTEPDSTWSAQIGEFFTEFAEASANEDWRHYDLMFMPTFLSIDPGSCRPVARDDLIAFLPMRKGLFDRARATGTTLLDTTMRPIDTRHVLADTTWDVVFSYPREPVRLRSTFLLRLEDRWRIAVYLNHNDLSSLLGVEI